MNCQISPLDIAVLKPSDFLLTDCSQPAPPDCEYVDLPAWFVWSSEIPAATVLQDERQSLSTEAPFILRGITNLAPAPQTLFVRFQVTNGKWLSNVREPMDSTCGVGHQRKCIHDAYFVPGSFIGIEAENTSGASIGAVIMFDGALRFHLRKRRRY